MRPREIRRHILADHAFIRGMLDEIDQRAFRVLEGREGELSALRAAGLAGIEHSKRLADEHREQRELLRYILSGLRDQSRPAPVVAGELRSFVELIFDDMAQEEMTIIKGAALRDPSLRPGPRKHSSSSIPPDSL